MAHEAEVLEIDRQTQTVSMKHHWMPFSANKDFKADPKLLMRAEGIYYWNQDGERLLDGSSGLFCCAAGHCRPEITEAVASQLGSLDYTPHFQRAHPSSFELAQRIAALTPEPLNRVFFVNSGSESVDTAMKIVLAYHRARGDGQRQRFISRERAYHGVNFGGVALSGMVKNRQAYGAGMPLVSHMRHTWLAGSRFSRGQPQEGAELAEDLQRMVDLYGADTIGACFVEPIAGSTGVLVPPVGYLERLREICDEHGILLVFDEVICGFGRLGKPFAAQAFGVTPDIMTLAKALTNGAQPMGAVVVSDDIYSQIVDPAPAGAVELFHGYTYSAHPAACAAGLATLDIYRDEDLFQRAADLSDYFLDVIYALSDLPVVTDIRGYGMLAGFDLASASVPGARGHEVQKRLFDAGLHIKTTGDCGIVAPPLVIDKEQIDRIGAILRDVLGRY